MAIPFPSQIDSLPKFGVSYDTDHGQGPILMPKVKYRFRVLFLGFGYSVDHGKSLTLNTNSCGLPSLSFDEQTIKSYNSTVYFPGRHSWNEISLVVRNTVDLSVEKSVGAQMQRQLDMYSQTGYRAASDYKFTTIIQTLDGNHSTVNSSWTLEGCYLTKSEYGELSYEDSGAMTISLGIRYDNAILEAFAGGNNSMWPDTATSPQGIAPNGTLTGR